MNNHDLHKAAQELEDTVSPYRLARSLVDAIEREQALAAHVERLREDVYDQANTILGEFGVRETIEDYLPDSYNDKPTTSLARRDLIKQSEALEVEANEWPADKYTECSHVRETILQTAAELHQQAAAL